MKKSKTPVTRPRQSKKKTAPAKAAALPPALFEESYNLSDAPSCIVNKAGVVVSATAAFCKLLGQPKNALHGAKLREAIATLSKSKKNLFVKARLDGKTIFSQRDEAGQVLELKRSAFRKTAFRDYTLVTARQVAADVSQSNDGQDFTTVLDAIPESIVVIDRHSKIVRLNRAAKHYLLKATGHKVMPGMSVIDLSADERKKAMREMIAKAFKGEQIHYTIKLTTVKSQFWFRVHFHPVAGRGAITNVCIRSEDISSEKALEDVEKNLSLVFNNTDESIMVFDRNLNVMAYNKVAFQRSATNPGDRKPFQKGISMLEVISPERQKEFLRLSRLAFKGKTTQTLADYRQADGQTLVYSLSYRPIRSDDGHIRNACVIATDVTARITAEREKDAYAARLSSILETMSDAFAAFDNNMILTHWNRQAEHLSGISRQAVLGKTILQALPMITQRTYPERIAEAQKTGTPLRFEEFIESDGRWMELSMYPSPDGMSVFFRDITKRKKIEAEVKVAKERYDLVAKATSDAIWDWDMQEDELYFGESYYTLFGYNSKTFSPAITSWNELIHPDEREQTRKALTAAIADPGCSNWEATYRYQKGDGSYAYVYDRGYIMRDEQGVPLRMIGAMQDIGVLKAQETKVLELNAVLEKKASELARSNADLEQFAYVASHDLQEPLRMVSSFMQLLERRYADRLDNDAKQYIRFAADGAERMKKLILDLLEYSRLRLNPERFAKVDMAAVVAEQAETFTSLLAENSGAIEVGTMPVVYGIKSQLGQLVQNLVSNAIKYAGDNPVRVLVNCADEKKEWHFSVHDNGIGIEPRFFEKIFVIFQRLHNRTKYSGTGIGLAICKSIVEHHGGRIWVESEPGNGSVFHFTIKKEL